VSKHRHCPRTIKAARVQVRCSGAMHTIELRPSGRLVFHDHDWRELALETELRKSANLPPGCRCEVILRQWRGDWVSGRIERDKPGSLLGCPTSSPKPATASTIESTSGAKLI
jgi:hypothetical protein